MKGISFVWTNNDEKVWLFLGTLTYLRKSRPETSIRALSCSFRCGIIDNEQNTSA